MEDAEILRLLEARDERGLQALRKQYEKGCRKIAMQYVDCAEDAEEVMNDVLLAVWNAVPPEKPENLFGFLSALTKRRAVSLARREHAAKRGGNEKPAVLEELAECVPGTQDVEKLIETRQLSEALNRFLAELPPEMRAVTVRRYADLWQVRTIAAQFGFSENKVKSMLHRVRKRLRQFLEKEEWL